MTTQQRYEAAVAYVRRAIAAVQLDVSNVPGFHAIDAYAARLKTEPVRDDLARLDARWLRAASDLERARVARDAELLADRTQENLPGAPQDRQRTNLFKGEQPTSTSSTSYAQELKHQLDAVAGGDGDAATSIGWGTLLLLGGGAALASQLFKWFGRDRPRNRGTRSLRPLVNRQLEVAAGRVRNASKWPDAMCPVCHRYKFPDGNGRLPVHEYPSGGMCPGSGRAPIGGRERGTS